MLDALSDFWKPNKKSKTPEKLQPELLQIGSSIGFGFVPQPSLSGRRLTVSHINTYQFGDEALTSFVLAQEKDAGVSMIVAESEGEQYLAISRRIPISDRMRMFESRDLDMIMSKPEAVMLACKDTGHDFKGWLVAGYKREIFGMSGRIFRGDFRKAPLPAKSQAQEFKYTLLVNENNEHAIEIEQYGDGRVEMYATIYRRTGDIGEITHPPRAELNRPDLKLASSQDADQLSAPTVIAKASPIVEHAPKPISLPEFEKTELPPAVSEVKPITTSTEKKEKVIMSPEPAKNGADTMKPVFPAGAMESRKQEIKTMSKMMNGMENEAVECDLKVAGRIIDEAIRNEMRLSDVVRRIIELPVANQEVVQIPVTLSDEDYALLAIRYSISSSDRNSIKKRIMEDLNDFSGDNKKKAA